jgi:tetratricopeptide (TPR) repeat protein
MEQFVMRRYLICVLGIAFIFRSVDAAAQQPYSAQRANAYIASHDGQGALSYAMAWTRAEPDNFYAWGALGAAYGQGLHEPEQAITAFKRGLALRPDSAECLNAMGVEYFNMQRYTEASEVFRRATQLVPAKSHYWNNLAATYSQTNSRDAALQALDSNEKLAAPHGTWLDWYVLGNGFSNQKAYDRAIDPFEQALRLNPRSGETWTNLGAAQQALGHWDQALAAFSRGKDLGNPAGAQDYMALQNAIAEAKIRAMEASRSSSNPMADFNRARGKEMSAWNANHPANPWRSGSDKPN